jgi:cell division GTPase FtsZ
VKPAGRGLEIVSIGLGQAGGNLSAEFFRRGYRALAFNTAHTDLASLAPGNTELSLPSEQRIYIGIDGYDGAGADLNYGRECIAAHAERIRDSVSAHAQGADVVVLTAGFGGGTGSAMSALVDTIRDLSLPLVALTTLPHEHESGIAKVNAVRAVNGLVGQQLLGWILIDNSLLAQVHGGVSLDKYYEKINRVIIEPLDDFNGLNDQEGVQAIRPMDGEDLRTLLLSGGVLYYGSGDLHKLSVEKVLETIRENLQYSSLMPAGMALDRTSYLGLVIEASEEALRETPFSFFEQINEQLKDESGGAAVYMGVYRSSRIKNTPAVWRLLSSSQSLPDGIQEMVTVARREGGALRDKLDRELTALDLSEIENLELFRYNTRKGPGDSPGKRRIPKKPDFSIETPVNLTSPVPRAGSRSGKPAESVQEGDIRFSFESSDASGSSSDKSGSEADAKSSLTPGQESLIPQTKASEADRETYDRLMKEYRDASADDDRSPIIDRLKQDAASTSSLIRYYAIRAMTKLDTEVFKETLVSATNDEDATVRAIAKKALR